MRWLVFILLLSIAIAGCKKGKKYPKRIVGEWAMGINIPYGKFDIFYFQNDGTWYADNRIKSINTEFSLTADTSFTCITYDFCSKCSTSGTLYSPEDYTYILNEDRLTLTARVYDASTNDTIPKLISMQFEIEIENKLIRNDRLYLSAINEHANNFIHENPITLIKYKNGKDCDN